MKTVYYFLEYDLVDMASLYIFGENREFVAKFDDYQATASRVTLEQLHGARLIDLVKLETLNW